MIDLKALWWKCVPNSNVLDWAIVAGPDEASLAAITDASDQDWEALANDSIFYVGNVVDEDAACSIADAHNEGLTL